MAGSYNRVILMGNLTRDVELKRLATGTTVGSFGLAVNRRTKDREEVTFVDCEAWDKTAENMAKYLQKGRAVLVEGRLKLDSWEDRASGQKRTKLKVVVDTFQFVDSKKEAEPAPQISPSGPGPSPEDDIPF